MLRRERMNRVISYVSFGLSGALLVGIAVFVLVVKYQAGQKERRAAMELARMEEDARKGKEFSNRTEGTDREDQSHYSGMSPRRVGDVERWRVLDGC